MQQYDLATKTSKQQNPSMSLCTLVILLCLSKLDLFCQSYTTENPAKEKSQKNNTENAALEKSQKNINKMQQEPLTVSQPDLPR